MLVSLAVPGLGHLLLGRPVRGIMAFALTIGAFAIGYSILRDRLWHVQAIPSSGLWRPFPLFLLPEFANFGSTVLVSLMREPDNTDSLRRVLLPRDGEHLGFLLTGFSGIASALWACDAWWVASAARRTSVAPAWAAALSWILPGAGHALAGQRSKGVLLGAAVFIVFAAGLILGAGHSVDRAAFSLWWAAQSFCGLGVMLSAFVTAPMSMDALPEMLDLGVILCTIGGLMNLMVMTDAFSVAERGAAGELPVVEPEGLA